MTTPTDVDLAALIRRFAADHDALPPDALDARNLTPEEINALGGPTPATQETWTVRRTHAWHLLRVRIGRRVVVPGRLFRAWQMARTPLYSEAA